MAPIALFVDFSTWCSVAQNEDQAEDALYVSLYYNCTRLFEDVMTHFHPWTKTLVSSLHICYHLLKPLLEELEFRLTYNVNSCCKSIIDLNTLFFGICGNFCKTWDYHYP